MKQWILLLALLVRGHDATPGYRGVRGGRGKKQSNMASLVVPDLSSYPQDKTSSFAKEFAFLEEALAQADQETVAKLSKSNNAAVFEDPRRLIVGGSNAGTEAYPYFALLLTYDSSNRIRSFCGATLIHDDFVVTAAHCYYDSMDEIRSVQLLVGATSNIAFNPATGTEFTTFGEDVYWAPEYPSSMARGSRANDIMVIKLENPVPSHYTRATLNTASTMPSLNSQVTAVGLGRTSTSGTQPAVLKHAELDVYSSGSCQVGYPSYDDQKMICASRHGQNACLGDSGGPLIVSSGGSDTLVGVISFGGTGGGCADVDPTGPSYHTRVSYFHSFIQRSVCDNSAHQTGMCASSVPAPTPVPAGLDLAGGGGSMNCFTYPSGWVDFEGKGCDWYAEWDRCSLFGDFYANNGVAANQACCACGGGHIAGQPAPPPPTVQPTLQPVVPPTDQPTVQPTLQPVVPPTDQPTLQPVVPPSPSPTDSPTSLPSAAPSAVPSVILSQIPSQLPSIIPTHSPSEAPSQRISSVPSAHPSLRPSSKPSSSPTITPSDSPSQTPSADPTDAQLPTNQPSYGGKDKYRYGTTLGGAGGTDWGPHPEQP